MKGDRRAAKYGGSAAVKISAGMRMNEIYAAMAEQDLIIVGGADLNVGIGGWITAGGHSPVSSIYGLGADQVLEMEMVTADGEYRVINEDHYPDLFWAMRGGGGQTFGVLLSVTVKAYPALPTALFLFSYNTTSDSDTFWSLVAYFHSQLPKLSEAGVMGYYYVITNDTVDPDPARRGKLAGGWILPNKIQSEAIALLKSIEGEIMQSHWGDEVFVSNDTQPITDFTKSWSTNIPEAVGVSGRLGSWLLGKVGLGKDLEILKAQLRKASPAPWTLIGHLVAGPGVREAQIPGGSNAVLPAWRKAYTHVVLPRSWPYLDETAKKAVAADLRDVEVPALKELDPESGAYVNEADPTNPDWKKDYYGSAYERLLDIKNQWDPEGVFWCKPCVASDAWEIKTKSDGVGQAGEQLCKKY